MAKRKCGKCGLVKDESDFYTPERITYRCKECKKAASREHYYKSHPNVKKHEWGMALTAAQTIAKHRKANPAKATARLAVQRLVLSGKLIKGCCEKCGSAITEGHHADYTNPVDVKWLCRKHHLELHRSEAV